MDFYAPISVYRAAFDHTGWQMSLAEFMNLGKEKYAADIIAYRSLKATLCELTDKQQAILAYCDELSAQIDAQKNPLGGTNTPEVDSMIAELHNTQAQLQSLKSDIDHCKEQAESIKRRFPAATISGLFRPTRAQANLYQHSGFICIDIDDHYDLRDADGTKRSYRQDLDMVPSVLASLPFVLYAAHSVGGRGYFAIIPLAVIDDTHTHTWYFEALQQEFLRLGIIIDPACRDTTRLRFVSYDPHPYRNPHAVPFTGAAEFVSRNERRRRAEEEHRRAEQQRRNAILNASDPDADFRHVQICVDKARQRGSIIVESYKDWYTAGMCLARAFGERGRTIFHDLSGTSAKYNVSDTDKQYDACISAAGRDPVSARGPISISSLFQMFERDNIRWYRD